MTDILSLTSDFHRLADIPEKCGLGDDELRALRINLGREEHREYLIAEDEDDVVEIADGLADQIVIACGTLLSYFGEECASDILYEVARSNLAKVDGSLGPIKRRDDGKLLKPDGWEPPDITGVLKRHGFVFDS